LATHDLFHVNGDHFFGTHHHFWATHDLSHVNGEHFLGYASPFLGYAWLTETIFWLRMTCPMWTENIFWGTHHLFLGYAWLTETIFWLRITCSMVTETIFSIFSNLFTIFWKFLSTFDFHPKNWKRVGNALVAGTQGLLIAIFHTPMSQLSVRYCAFASLAIFWAQKFCQRLVFCIFWGREAYPDHPRLRGDRALLPWRQSWWAMGSSGLWVFGRVVYASG
jgi:hypothetical protein